MQAPSHLAEAGLAGRRALFAMQGMCYTQDITDPSIRLHMWQQLVLPVVSYGSGIWGPQYLYFMEPMYFKDNPGEQIHLHSALVHWCPAPDAAHPDCPQGWQSPAPGTKHWLRRALQLWNKLSTADPDSWLAHTAFVANIQLWQSSCNTCWADKVMAHMQQLGLQDTLDSQQPICWSQRLDTDSIEVAMDTTLAAAWSSYQHQPYRQLAIIPL
jgi:hypothetical protein